MADGGREGGDADCVMLVVCNDAGGASGGSQAGVEGALQP